MSSDEAKMILEHFDEKFALLLENVEAIIEQKVRPIIQEELIEVKEDVKIIKTAVRETNRDFRHLEKRVVRLEAS